MNNELPKDRMFIAKSADKKLNKKGGDHVIFRLTEEEAKAYAEEILASVTDKGVKLEFHLTQKSGISEATGAPYNFLSGISFVKGIQEFGAPRMQGASSPQRAGKPNSVTSSAVSAADALRRPKAS